MRKKGGRGGGAEENKIKFDLHENHEEEAHVHSQVEQVPNKLQVESIYSLPLPLSFHKHVTYMEYIFHECCNSCCSEYHVPER